MEWFITGIIIGIVYEIEEIMDEMEEIMEEIIEESKRNKNKEVVYEIGNLTVRHKHIEIGKDANIENLEEVIKKFLEGN